MTSSCRSVLWQYISGRLRGGSAWHRLHHLDQTPQARRVDVCAHPERAATSKTHLNLGRLAVCSLCHRCGASVHRCSPLFHVDRNKHRRCCLRRPLSLKPSPPPREGLVRQRVLLAIQKQALAALLLAPKNIADLIRLEPNS